MKSEANGGSDGQFFPGMFGGVGDKIGRGIGCLLGVVEGHHLTPQDRVRFERSVVKFIGSGGVPEEHAGYLEMVDTTLGLSELGMTRVRQAVMAFENGESMEGVGGQLVRDLMILRMWPEKLIELASEYGERAGSVVRWWKMIVHDKEGVKVKIKGLNQASVDLARDKMGEFLATCAGAPRIRTISWGAEDIGIFGNL